MVRCIGRLRREGKWMRLLGLAGGGAIGMSRWERLGWVKKGGYGKWLFMYNRMSGLWWGLSEAVR